jgi:hypothetical protein
MLDLCPSEKSGEKRRKLEKPAVSGLFWVLACHASARQWVEGNSSRSDSEFFGLASFHIFQIKWAALIFFKKCADKRG